MTALHVQIRRDLEDQIRSGKLKPGDRIPFEHELMQTYGCARMTVNKAVSALTADGLVERRRRAGSFVRFPQLDATVLDIPDIESEIKQRNDRYEFQLTERWIHRAETAEEADLVGEGGLVLSLTGVHFAAGKPLALEERLINLAAVPEAAEADFTEQSPGHWLLQQVPWTHVENQISAISANQDIATLLGARKGLACLVVKRRTWREGEPVTSVTQTFDGGSYRLTATFDHV